MECDEGMLTLPTLKVRPGFYRHEHTSQVLECRQPDACKGGSAVGPTDSCAESYTGPLCGSCAAEHFRDFLSGECHACDEEAGLSPSTIVIVVLVAVAAVYQVWSKCVRSKKSEEEKDVQETGGGKEMEKEEPGEEEGSGFSAQFSTILVCWQMTSQIGASVRTQGGDEMPEPFATFGRVVGVCRKTQTTSFFLHLFSKLRRVRSKLHPPTHLLSWS